MRMSESFDVVVIGGGVAGTFLAGLLGRKGISVLLLEKDSHQPPLARRISVSGNGRCNFFNEDLLDTTFTLSSLKPLAPYFLHDGTFYPRKTLDFLTKELGIRYIKEGKLYYPYFNRSECILHPILSMLEGTSVSLRKAEVLSLDRRRRFLRCRMGEEVREVPYAKAVFCIGGRSYDRNDFSPRLLSSLCLPLTPFSPSLCPLMVRERIPSYLVGTRLRGNLSLLSGNEVLATEMGEVLFRADSLSGICVFQLSRVLNEALRDGRKGPFVLRLDYSSYEGFRGEGSSVASFPLALRRYLSETGRSPFEPLSFQFSSFPSFERSQVSFGGLRLGSFQHDFSLKGDDSFFAIGECLDVNLPCGGYHIGTALIEAMVVSDRLGG